MTGDAPPGGGKGQLDEIVWVRAAAAPPKLGAGADEQAVSAEPDTGSDPAGSETTAPADEPANFESEPAALTREPHDPWQDKVDAAKVTWDRLSMAELIDSQGIEHRLIALVQSCYGISVREATRQVKTFFQEQES